MRKSFPPFSLVILFTTLTPIYAAPPIKDSGFETGEAGRPPAEWTPRSFSEVQGFTSKLTDKGPAHGRLCLEVGRADGLTFGQYAAVWQSIPADELRGKRVRFTASIRTSGLTGFSGAGLYARVYRPDFRPGHAGEMNDRPERRQTWVRRSVVVDVAADAEPVDVGFILHTTGSAWFDEADLEVLGPAAAGP